MEQFLTNIGLKGMRYYGAKSWNNIFLNFTDVNSIYSVKARFKDMLLDNNPLEDKWRLVFDDEKCITVSKYAIITIWRDYKQKK